MANDTPDGKKMVSLFKKNKTPETPGGTKNIYSA
jgi:hypothetical protein